VKTKGKEKTFQANVTGSEESYPGLKRGEKKKKG